MKELLLDKIFDVGTTYRAEENKAYVIEAIGTNSTTKLTVKVAGAPCCEIVDVIAPLVPTSSNILPAFKLGTCFIVVPPNYSFSFEGESGKRVRCVGKILILEPDEVLPAHYKARFEEQSKKFISYQEGTYSSAAAASIAEKQQENILTWTVPAGERWVFNTLYEGEVWTTADTIDRELLVTRIYVDDAPKDIIEWEMGRLGIASLAAPHPPRDAVSQAIFSFEEKPMELGPGRTLRITWINTGPAATLAAGETLEARVKIVGINELI